ncbi:MAG: dTMP kinase [Firmicutes bacterium]|nr:dTMP kinase [Alicyclobacillaceae bacterium]MCL6497238.1 dTMP kinase [Bacillota bacterium]
MPGKLISFEGVDGVGKTTQVEWARRWLTALGMTVTVVQEPGSTPLGTAVRQLLLDGPPIASARAEALLFAAARAELVETVVRPALARGEVVLADRFVDSTWAYQVYGRGLDAGWVEAVHRGFLEGVWPDGTIWLEGQPHRTLDQDRMEREPEPFRRRVEAGYAALMQAEPYRWVRIAADGSPAEVFSAVQAALRRWLSIPEEEARP